MSGKKTDTDSFFVTKRKHKELTKNNKSTLKCQQIFRSEKHNVFTKEIDKIGLSSNDDKKMQSIDFFSKATSNKLKKF